MRQVGLSPAEAQCNDESVLLDGLYEFHPDFFDDLDANDRKAIEEYYLIGKETPENIFEYRISALLQDPSLQERAEKAFGRLMDIAGIQR